MLAVPARVRLRAGLVVVAAAVFAGGAWYLKNAIVTGNPFYPAFFGGKFWNSYAQQELDSIGSRYGTGSVLRLPLLPLDLLAHGGSFDRGEYASTASFVFAPFALLQRRLLRPVALSLAGVVVYLVAWWELTAQTRFLLPALVVLACLAGVGAAALLERRAVVARTTVAILVLAAIAWLVPSAALVRQLLPPVVGAESRTHFLQRLTGTQEAFNEIADRVDGVVAFATYQFTFNFPGRAFVLDAPEFTPQTPVRVFRARVREQRARYAVVEEGTGALIPAQLYGCARRLHGYPARFVTSRSQGTGIPITLVLYSLAACWG